MPTMASATSGSTAVLITASREFPVIGSGAIEQGNEG